MPCPPPVPADPQAKPQLSGRIVGASDVANFPLPDQLVQDLERFLFRRVRSSRWVWYKSMVSVCSRRWLSSTARRMCVRLSPSPSGPSHIRPRTFVARKKRSRWFRAATHRPMISSVFPAWLFPDQKLSMSAVSKKFPPASGQASIILNESASSAVQPNCIVPRAITGTSSPVRPGLRYHMNPPSPRIPKSVLF